MASVALVGSFGAHCLVIPEPFLKRHFAFQGVPDEDDVFKKPREVVHRNTRFVKDPFSQAVSKSQLQQAAALNAQVG